MKIIKQLFCIYVLGFGINLAPSVVSEAEAVPQAERSAPKVLWSLHYEHRSGDDDPWCHGVLVGKSEKSENAEVFVYGNNLEHAKCPGKDCEFGSRVLEGEEAIQILDRVLEYQRDEARPGCGFRGGKEDTKVPEEILQALAHDRKRGFLWPLHQRVTRVRGTYMGIKVGPKFVRLGLFTLWSREEMLKFLETDKMWNFIQDLAIKAGDIADLTEDNVWGIAKLIEPFHPYSPYKPSSVDSGELKIEIQKIQSAESFPELIEKLADSF